MSKLTNKYTSVLEFSIIQKINKITQLLQLVVLHKYKLEEEKKRGEGVLMLLFFICNFTKEHFY